MSSLVSVSSHISRTMFCERCFKAQRPHNPDRYIVWGTSRSSFIVYDNVHDVHPMHIGFTPHLVKYGYTQRFYVNSIPKEIVTLSVVCGMEGCGIRVIKSTDSAGNIFYNLQTEKSSVREVHMYLNDYLAMFRKPDLGYKLGI